MTDDAPAEHGGPETIDLTHGSSPLPRLNGIGHGNGNGTGVDLVPEVDVITGPLAELDGIEWNASYDRDSVERHLLELDAEQARLEAEIAEAEGRTAAAEEALAARATELEADLGAVVVAARAELARMEREQEEAVAAIRAEAEAEAARIRQTARVEADAVRGAASSLATAMPTSDGFVSEPEDGLAPREDRADAG